MCRNTPQMSASPKVETIRLVEIGDDRRQQAKFILKDAKAQKLDDVLIIGRSDDGELWAASSLNAGQSLWLIEKLRARLLEGSPWALV